jgi:large subunit ribosomal protein L21
MKDYEKMTVKELVDELTSQGVSFNKKARKAELIELLLSESRETSEEPGAKEAGAKAAAKPGQEEKLAQKAAPITKSPEAKKSPGKVKAKREAPADSGYAIIRTGGKQYQVSAGSLVRVEKIAGNIGDTVELKDVLVVIQGDSTMIGQPIVEGAVVTARIVEQDKAKKVLVFKKKRRKGYRVKRGHRQMFTALEISGISV